MPGRNGSKGEIGKPGEPGTMVGTKTLVHCNSKLYNIKGNRGPRGRMGEPGFNGTNGFDVRYIQNFLIHVCSNYICIYAG